MKKTVAVAVLGLFVCGCSSMPVKKVDANAWAKDYYNQPRSTDLVTLKGKGMSITLNNVDEMKVSTQLPIISVIPREPSTLDALSSYLPTLGLIGMGMAAVNKGPTVVNPVSQPTQIIEQPVLVK